MTDQCAYCGSDVDGHDPVFVQERRDGERADVGAFCNDACLAAWIEAEDRTTGACCEVDL